MALSDWSNVNGQKTLHDVRNSQQEESTTDGLPGSFGADGFHDTVVPSMRQEPLCCLYENIKDLHSTEE